MLMKALLVSKAGCHSKAGCPRKPVKWGLSVFALGDCKTGCVAAFEPHYGATVTKHLCQLDLQFTSHIVLDLFEKVLLAIGGPGYHLYTDLSPLLAEELLLRNVLLTSTVMPNRKNMPQQLKKKIKKGEVAVYRLGDLYVALARLDKRQETVLSSAHGPRMQEVTRKQSHFKTMTLLKPVFIGDYAGNMGLSTGMTTTAQAMCLHINQ